MERNLRREQKERTRRGLVEKATKIFARQGIELTSTAEISKALKVSHGTLFLHFPTREELILRVVEDFGDRLSEALGRRLEADLPLFDLLRAHLSVLAEFEDFYLRLVAESQTLPARVRSIVYAMNASLSYRIYRAAEPLMRAGTVKRLGQVALFTTWMSLLHYHLLNRDLLSEKTPIFQHKGEDILRLYRNLIES